MQQAEHDFWAKVSRCHHGRTCKRCCWEWQGGRSPKGYGYASWGGKSMQAYRLALILTAGAEVLGRQFVARHLCNNPPCCNPLHLQLGGRSDNTADYLRINAWRLVLRSIRAHLRRDTALGVFLRCERAQRVCSIEAFGHQVDMSYADIRRLEEGDFRTVDLTEQREHLGRALGKPLQEIPKLEPRLYGYRMDYVYDIRPVVDPILFTLLDFHQWAWACAQHGGVDEFRFEVTPSKYCPLT